MMRYLMGLGATNKIGRELGDKMGRSGREKKQNREKLTTKGLFFAGGS